MISFYVYELDLSEDMKIHSTFHINLLLFSKHDLMKQQVSELSFVIVESEKNLYFINLINNMK